MSSPCQSRKFLLEEAQRRACSEQYGKSANLDSALGVYSRFLREYLDTDAPITPHDAAIACALQEIAHIQTGTRQTNNYVNALVYLAMAGELSREEK
jgi:hypothetical protein